MAVRSDELVDAAHVFNGAVQTLYTVPADRTVIIKDVRVRRQGNANAFIWVVGAGGSATVILEVAAAPAAAAQAVKDPPPWIVLREGGQIRCFGTNGEIADLHISGAVLSGDPT